MAEENEYAYPADVYKRIQWSMIIVHETLKSGHNSIMGHLDNPPLNDLYNFLSYCLVWADCLEKHHALEERTLFPALKTKIDLSNELEQHKHIHEGIHNVINFLNEAKADNSKFDAAKLRNLLDAFKDVLFTHLDEEIQDLAAEKLQVFTQQEVQVMIDELEKEAKNDGGLVTIIPFVFGNIPPQYKLYFPPTLPRFVRSFLIPYVIAPIHGGWWKYCPNKL